MDWARRSTFYHIVIDRFATGDRQFRHAKGPQYEQQLGHWMGGSLSGVIQSLDYLQDLGIGALLLTPFFRGKKYHGYWTTGFLQVDPHFGEPQHLRQLIAAAHQRGIRVVMDLPFTHCHIDAMPAQEARNAADSCYRDWFQYESTGRFQGFYGDSDLPEFNLELPDVIAFLKRVLDHWLEFGFDGIRFDHAKRPSPTFWKRVTDYLRERHPRVFLLGENWHESGKIGALTEYLHGELNIPLSTALRRFLAQPGAREIHATIDAVRTQQLLRKAGYLLPTFLDNHDMERASLVARGDRDILKLGFLLQMSLPDPPIIYYGSERAQVQTANLPVQRYERDRYFREPMDWKAGEEMRAWVMDLIRIRNENIDLFTSEPCEWTLQNGQALSYRYSNGDSTVMIAININSRPQRISLPPGSGATLLIGGGRRADQCRNQIELPACGGAILKFIDRQRTAFESVHVQQHLR